jgi:hypothetical protein
VAKLGPEISAMETAVMNDAAHPLF